MVFPRSFETMSKNKRILVVVVVLALGFWATWWLKGFIAEDRCMDAGGVWNAKAMTCVGARSYP